MIPRTTTVGSLKTYRYNLQRSAHTMEKAQTTVTTGRTFNSFADDPTTAARSFQLRRAYLRTSSQYDLNESVVRKYEVAYGAMESVSKTVDTDEESVGSAYYAILRAQNAATASGRNALGQELTAHANDLVQTINGRYGDNFVFAGADGLNVPFTWEPKQNPAYDPDFDPDNPPDPANPPSKAEIAQKTSRYLKPDGAVTNYASEAGRVLCYRGIPVDTSDPDELKKLDYYSNSEKKYVDIGLGYDMNGGKVESSSVYDIAMQGVNFLGGYGTETKTTTIPDPDNPDGTIEVSFTLPRNIVTITERMGAILQNCSSNSGAFASDMEEAEFDLLAEQFEEASARIKDKHINLTTQAQFLKTNQQQLKTNADSINEQIEAIDYVDPAAAISDFIFAKYSYDTALKVGNSILAQSLMDYLSF